MSEIRSEPRSNQEPPSQFYRPRLVVYVVWHPRFAGGPEIANRIYGHLMRESHQPIARGIGIPVYFRTSTDPEKPPAPIEFDQAHHTAVVVLVDDALVAARDRGWGAYLEGLWRHSGGDTGLNRVLPVKLSPNAFHIGSGLDQANFIRFDGLEGEARHRRLLLGLTHELCRMLLEEPRVSYDPSGRPARRLTEPVRVFISHAKKDGLPLASWIRDYISEQLQLDTFFDVNDIPYGSAFADVLEGNVERSALLIVQSDEYCAREWCQREVLHAKRERRPVLVLHAVRTGERRSFPYLGNVPTIRVAFDEVATEVLRSSPSAPDIGLFARWLRNILGAQADPVAASPALANVEAIVGQLLGEVLRAEHFLRYFPDVARLYDRAEEIRPLGQAPELLTLLELRRAGETVKTFVYPDPPLGDHELELLRLFDPDLRLTTPVQLLARAEQIAEPGPTGGEALAAAVTEADAPTPSPRETVRQGLPQLSGWKIGLSIGDIDEAHRDQQIRLGLGKAHLDDAMIEFARYTLAAGATLAYGGDLRPEGYTEILHDLIRTYSATGGNPKQRLLNYLAWHIAIGLDDRRRAEFADVAQVVELPPPTGLDLDPSQPEVDAVVRARCLTAMRERMNEEIAARILLGGRLAGYSGRYPGVAEEAYLALRSKKPTYLIGGFGGCARAVFDAIDGRSPETLTLAWQEVNNPALPESHTPSYQERVEAYNRHAAAHPEVEPIDYEALDRFYRELGLEGLGQLNGLTPDENRRLAETIDLVEMIYLVLKGLLQRTQPTN